MRLRFSLLSCAISAAFAAPHAFAQTLPDAGQAQQGIDQQPLQLPPEQTLELTLPDTPAADDADSGARLQVSGFTLEGNTAIASDVLLPLLADLRGREVRLGELRAGAARITALYRQHGYLLARAYVPAQTIEGGIVKVTVLEGRYGQVGVDNTGVKTGGSALAPLAALHSGEVVQAGQLQSTLLLLQDIPGLKVKGVLSPGDAVGTSDLLVHLRPGPRLSGSIEADNYGNVYTGEYRLGGSLNVNNPLGLGDRLSLRALGSNERQLYGRLAYQLPVGPWATQAGVAYSDMHYELGRDFSELDASGRARITSVFVRQPLLRSRDASLYLQLQYDDKQLRDEIGLFDSLSKKHARVSSATLSGNARDGWLGGGVSGFSLGWHYGRLGIKGADNQALDAATAGTAGQFNKVEAGLARLQRLTGRFSLYAQWRGQWADGNLDSSEKLFLGGADGVRAYGQGEASGDQGWLGNLELRYALSDTWQLSAFVDHGRVMLNKKPWDSGSNRRSLSGSGLGVGWTTHNWRFNAALAWKLGNASAESGSDRNPRLWAQLVRGF